MKTIMTIFLALFITANLATAQDTLYVYKAGAQIYKQAVTGVDSITFKNSPSNTVTDIEGNIYKTVTIGTQTWMAENLKTTHYNDGTAIPFITNNTAWSILGTAGYSWYNGSEITYKSITGALYNWFVIETGKLCPSGWHIPSLTERDYLINILGGLASAGDKLKANDFKAQMGGARYSDGTFNQYGQVGAWWLSTSSTSDITYANTMIVSFDTGSYMNNFSASKKMGFSVRCVKNY